MLTISTVNPKNPGEITGEVSVESFEELAQEILLGPWAPATFLSTKRRIAEALSTKLLVLDVDSGCTLEEAKEKFKDYKHIIATTRNHQKEKNGLTCDRFRIILELETEVTNDEHFKRVFDTAKSQYPFIDAACKDISRFYFASLRVYTCNNRGISFRVPENVTPDITLSTIPEHGKLDVVSDVKGELSKATLKFLLEGAPKGHRHAALVKACFDMKEQGYSEAEAFAKIEVLANTVDPDFMDSSSQTTIKDIFANRATKYDVRPSDAQAASVFVSASELLGDTFDYLSNKDLVSGDKTGIEGLDKMLGGGFRQGELTVLMASAKSGKNTLYHYMMHTMLKQGLKLGYASRELDPASEVLPNLLSIELKKNFWKENITEELKAKAYAQAAGWPLYFAPGYGHFPINQMREWIGTLKALGVQHFWMDHFHYMLAKEDHDAVSGLIKELKTITKEFRIHVNLIVQPKSLQFGQTLGMDTLRGGASINQALDNLLILERVKGERNISKLKLEVARHKLAAPGEIYLQYDPETTRFEEVDSLLVDTPEPTPQLVPHPKFTRTPMLKF